jgi:antitoxin VapB
MSETRMAKLFMNGSSQAVRLPADFRFEGDRVYIRRDDISGDVILSQRPDTGGWNELFQLVDSIESCPDFMNERPMNRLPLERDLFEG